MDNNDDSLVVERGMVAVLNRSEIDQQIATAKRYPRSITNFIREGTSLATLDEATAAECIYSLPRGGKLITGPSARFAEIIANTWGNCRAGARVIDENGKFVTAQGVFHDLERNVAITYEVQRRITDKHGKTFNDDMIGVTANAACSIALRNAVLKGVPKAFWAGMEQAARQVIAGDARTLSSRRDTAIAVFAKMGVPVENLLSKLELKGVEDITGEHLIALNGLRTAIKEGEASIESVFFAKAPASGDKRSAAALNDTLDSMGEDGRTQAPAAEPKKKAPAADDAPPEPTESDAPEAPDAADTAAPTLNLGDIE